MIYSCFNEDLGLYEHYEDSSSRPVNSDLPVPQLGPDAGDVGVPARESGRPLPVDAVMIGTGPVSRGMIVRCNSSGAGLSSYDISSRVSYSIIGGVSGALFGSWASRGGMRPDLPADGVDRIRMLGLVAGGAVGALLGYLIGG